MYVLQTENYWLGTVGVPVVPSHPKINILVRPIDMDMHEAAWDAYVASIGAVPEDARTGADVARAFRAFTRRLLELGAVDWQGFVDAKKKPVAFSAEGLAAVIRNPELFPFIDAVYGGPFLMRQLEKNGYAPSANGTSSRGGTAERATKDVPAKAGAKPVPTKSTSRKPAKAKPSGR